jgi:radical SAM protein with 4Fe4S-binding SPASM domain
LPNRRHWVDATLSTLPPLRSLYWRHSARVKKAWCLALHRRGWLRPSSFVMWISTRQCNYSCPFCETAAGLPAPDELTTQEAKAFLDDLSRMRVRRLLISGGEPTLRPDLPVLLEHASRLAIAPGLISNGSLIQRRWPELKRFRYFLYMTSLDGLPEFHDQTRGRKDAYTHALKSLDLFASIGVPTRVVNTVVYAENLAQLPRLMQQLEASGATLWQLCPTFGCGRAAGQSRFQMSGSELRALVDFVRDHRAHRNLRVVLAHSRSYLSSLAGWEGDRPFFCGAGLTRCTVMPNGDVLGCSQAHEFATSEGNIRHTPLSRIWKEGFASLRRNVQPPACRGCQCWNACQGGCWAEREIRGECLRDVLAESREKGDRHATLR